MAATDADVAAEEQRVQGMISQPEPLVVRRLGKQYPKSALPAVAGVSVGMPASQCFGLLGINGAGKTTTFRMLTGEIKPSCGSAMLNGTELCGSGGWGRLRGCSYCPQENTLFRGLTVRQHLSFFMRLRGVAPIVMTELAACLISEVGLEAHASKRAGQLSGGNQRKLQLAIALIGYPAVIFLDEPTSGMDPGARRKAWTCIRRAVAMGSAVVLTSHSMDECENLCDRLVIMVAGSFQCLGSVQYLKGKFGNTYNFKVKLTAAAAAEEVKAKVAAAFPAARLAEHHSRTLTFEIAAGSAPLSRLFTGLRELRRSTAVEDFSISQTTLETVFLRLADIQETLQQAAKNPKAPQDPNQAAQPPLPPAAAPLVPIQAPYPAAPVIPMAPGAPPLPAAPMRASKEGPPLPESSPSAATQSGRTGTSAPI